MDAEEFYKTLAAFDAKCDSRERENPTGSDEDIDPRIQELIEKGMRAIEQLDPIISEKYRDDPATLAEWDEIMHMCDDLDEDRTDNAADSSIP